MNWNNPNYIKCPHSTSLTVKRYHYPFTYYPNYYFQTNYTPLHNGAYIPQTRHIENFSPMNGIRKLQSLDENTKKYIVAVVLFIILLTNNFM